MEESWGIGEIKSLISLNISAFSIFIKTGLGDRISEVLQLYE